ncbi:hypothetical protein ASD31_23260 [Rhizobium sp. Root482]|nr:hypothetical protein ASD31_23260 [Rhizobium sp. Root482]
MNDGALLIWHPDLDTGMQFGRMVENWLISGMEYLHINLNVKDLKRTALLRRSPMRLGRV